MTFIILDGTIYQYQAYGGISNYHTGLIKATPPRIFNILIAPFYRNYALDECHDLANFFIFGFRLRPNVLDKLLIKLSLYLTPFITAVTAACLSLFGCNVYIQLTYCRKVPFLYKLLSNIPIISTIHDLIPEEFPHLFSPSSLAFVDKIDIFNSSSKILFVSNTTLSSFNYHYSRLISPLLSSKSIFVTYNTPYISSESDNFHDTRLLQDSYVLTVSGSAPYKNLSHYIQLATYYYKKSDFKFVIVGNRDSIISAYPNIPPNVHLVEPCNKVLFNLYHYADCYVSCSLAEGFNIPLIEAASFHLPIICSDIPIHREILADSSAVFYDLSDINTLYSRLNDVLSNINNIILTPCDYSAVQARFHPSTVYRSFFQHLC